MHTLVKTLGAAAMAAAVAVAAVAPAVAAPGTHAPGQGGNQPGAEWWLTQNQFRGHHYAHRWNGNRHYGGYYGGGGYYGYPGYYGYGYDPGAAVAAGLIGGVFGTIAGAALSHSGGGSHVWRCEHRYHSYRPATNTFTGNDGLQHACRL